jgi:hypothetical protein
MMMSSAANSGGVQPCFFFTKGSKAKKKQHASYVHSSSLTNLSGHKAKNPLVNEL